ncbi:MAG: single stranded DNA-binding protein [Actinomycetia bacterium]|nr:single stranded DNA-binding protein [Actinomycetes bacterium]
MASSSTITIVGNVTRDPELRFTPSGQANTRFGVAVNRRWMDRKTNEWQESTSFFDVVCWQEMAENASESLPKGSRVIVTGRLEQRSYDDKDGNRRSVVEIIADEIGPSLRYANAQVTKNERRGGDFGGGGGASRPQPAAATAPAGGGGGAGPSYDDFGEEPF